MQTSLPLVGEVPRPKSAPDAVLARISSECEAIRVSLIGLKAVYVADVLGISESYLSLIRSGQRRMSDRLVTRFCHATGSLLLQQYRDLQSALRAIKGQCAREREESLARELRAA